MRAITEQEQRRRDDKAEMWSAPREEGEAMFRVTVAIEGREPRTYEVAAQAAGDGFEQHARTRALWRWFWDEDRRPDGAPLRGEMMTFDVEAI